MSFNYPSNFANTVTTKKYLYLTNMSDSSLIPSCPNTPNNLEDQAMLMMKAPRKSHSFPEIMNQPAVEIDAIAGGTNSAMVSSQPSLSQPLSPPLSPYQTNAELNTAKLVAQPLIELPQQPSPTTAAAVSASSASSTTLTVTPPPALLENLENLTPTSTPTPTPTFTSLLNTKKEYVLENYKDYKLTINVKPNKNYYQSHFEFLDKYYTSGSMADKSYTSIPLPVRRYKKRTLATPLAYESTGDIPEEPLEKNTIKRKRITKTREIFDNSDTDFTTTTSPPPKKRKRRVTNTNGATSFSSPSIPIAIQQQMLIDESIPDYSPNAKETLPPDNHKCLKIEWKGQPMDLSNDPNLSKYTNLHPAEIQLASILRLPLAVYMDSKRRLFFEKVSKVKLGKQFRRTDAQKACRIDVNKASRLFAAFEKVGWLNDDLFKKYL
ncbi:hypothetical protein KGF56_002690 [Candida oxycetoniae]|uniref:SWIRM domain-containing protein n=1 Tax=Candida oxycetoniae TaxID=497107 RepID=A0AAI9WXQ8_9ASCO|nr:uncharacterized protein KGF56_002690 [Candida oxycetoniae]KAI3404498.2 hypothetical protein KGF56_002690 [Candida oxycetoniae]